MGSQNKPLIEVAGHYGALLSAVEVGLGSILHSFRIPFSGHSLSLNQGFLLSRCTIANRKQKRVRFLGASVSNIAALLKSLSPAGKKLTPMLAISAQGCLFSVGTIVLGPNPAGILLGMLLLSLWAFIQPVLIYYLLYGKTIIHVANYFFEKLNRAVEFEVSQLLWILAAVIAIKLTLAVLIGLGALAIPDDWVERYQRKLLSAGKSKRARWSIQPSNPSFAQSAGAALRDLINPMFLVSLALTAAFFYFSQSSHSKLIWGLLRPIAVGFLIFLAVRTIPWGKVAHRINRGRLSNFVGSFQSALKTLRDI